MHWLWIVIRHPSNQSHCLFPGCKIIDRRQPLSQSDYEFEECGFVEGSNATFFPPAVWKITSIAKAGFLCSLLSACTFYWKKETFFMQSNYIIVSSSSTGLEMLSEWSLWSYNSIYFVRGGRFIKPGSHLRHNNITTLCD